MNIDTGLVPERLWHSPAETAVLLGVSMATVYRLVARGELDSAKLGHRTLRISRASIESYVREALAG